MAGQPFEKYPGTNTGVKSAIILAGGLGTRLRGVVRDLPKAMAPIKGRPFLEYQMDYWIGQGIRHFILSVGYRREVIMKHFGENYKEARMEYAVEESPLGTGGGMLLAIEKLDKHAPFLLLNGDTFFEVALVALAEFHRCHRSDWTFSLFRTEEKKRFLGMEVDTNGRVLSLRSNSDPSARLANGGVCLVNPKILSSPKWRPDTQLSLEDEILPSLFDRKVRFFGYACQGRFIDIGLPEDYARSADMLLA